MTRVSWLSWLSSWVKVVRGLFSPGTSYHPDTEDTEDTEARGAVWAVTLVREGSSTEGRLRTRWWCWSTDLLFRDRIRLSLDLQLSRYLDWDWRDGDRKSSNIFVFWW